MALKIEKYNVLKVENRRIYSLATLTITTTKVTGCCYSEPANELHHLKRMADAQSSTSLDLTLICYI